MHHGAHSGPLVLAVGGGKGGVGKSVLATNLGLAIAHTGGRVVLVDGDLGSANLHTMLGIDRPGRTLRALFEREVESIEEIVVPTRYPRLELVPGSVAIPGAANPGHARKLKLLRHISKLDADIVILDCGAGVHFNVLDFYNAADLHLLVATPQLVSMQNAYGFTKGAVHRMLRQAARNATERELIDTVPVTTETDRVRDLLMRIETRDPSLSAHLRHQLRHYHLRLIGNQVGDKNELNPIHALSRMLGDFLSLRVPVVGALRQSSRIHYSVSRRVPFFSTSAGDRESRLLLSLAETYLETDVASLRQERMLPAEEADPPEPRGWGTPASDRPGLPGSLERYQREHERIPVLWPVTLQLNGKPYKAQAVDIGGGGLRIVWGGLVNEGHPIAVRVDAVPHRPVLQCRVANRNDDGLGLSFDPPPPDSALQLLLDLAEQGQLQEAGVA